MSEHKTTPAAISWGADGAPRSDAFGDVYFNVEDGLAETRHVFLGGCGLSGAYFAETAAGRDQLAIAELGFGLGLNFFATLHAFAALPAPRPRLLYASFEIAPPAAEDIRRLAARWPELAPGIEALLDSGDWPPGDGVHERDIARGVRLRLGVGDAAELVPAWKDAADAWFLDGFSPAKNPALWTPTLLGAVAARMRPGGRLATYSAAGHVRRALSAAGLHVEKRPGFGRKRDMTVATAPL